MHIEPMQLIIKGFQFMNLLDNYFPFILSGEYCILMIYLKEILFLKYVSVYYIHIIECNVH